MTNDRFPHFLELLLLCPVVVGLLSMVALGQTNYHVRLAQEYYNPAQSGERPGRFMGQGAALLGLEGKVTPEAFRAAVIVPWAEI